MNSKKTSKGFLLSVFFLVFWLAPFSLVSGADFDSEVPNFVTDITEIGENVFAQTSEVTIKLEKRIPRSTDDSSIETAQGIVKSSQDPQDYEDMEDPFAGDSEDLPIMSDPLEGYNRWMFGVNETIYDNVLEPVARGYRDTIHENLRIALKNVFFQRHGSCQTCQQFDPVGL